MPKRKLYVIGLMLALTVMVAGCSIIPPRKGGVMEIVPKGETYDVTYRYTLPKPPPPGEVYVMWLINVDSGRLDRLGTIPPGVNLVVQVQVNFQPTGVIVSPEPSADVDRPGDVWELLDGRVTN